MRTFFVYLLLEYKRSVKVLLKSAGSLLLMMLFTAAGVLAVSHVLLQSQIFRAIEVGVVIPEEETETRMVVQFISAMESVKSICSFCYMEEEEAEERLRTGEVQAVIALPERFYYDMYTEGKAHTVVSFPKETALNVQVFRELLMDGVSLLKTAEAGVFASKETAKTWQAQMDEYELANFISYIYIENAFQRGDIFQKNVCSPLGQMDLYQYYFAAATAVILLMSGLNMSFLYQKQSRAVEQKLGVLGLRRIRLAVIKVLVMGNVLWILGAFLYGMSCLACHLLGSSFIWFDQTVLLALIPACMGIAVYFHLVYSLFGKGIQGAVFLLSVNSLMLLCSGAVIPAAYLPELVGKAGAYLPLNFLNQYCADMIFGTVRTEQVLAMVCWSIAGIGIGAVFSWNNTLSGTNYN